MKRYYYLVLLFLNLPGILWAQTNIGIGGTPLRSRLEVYSGTGFGTTSAIFGTDAVGLSFQQNWPSVGFNQYRDTYTGYGRYIGSGYAAVQYLDPGNGIFALDMHPTSGIKDASIASEFYRAFSIASNGTISFGKGFNNSNLVVDYLNVNGTNQANGSIYFYGSQYPSFINTSNLAGMPTQVGPGKDGGTTYINDISSGYVGIGSTANLATKLAINTMPFYLTSLSIRHATDGGGLLLIEQNSFNNWEWYVSNDNPVWLGQKYNGLLIGDFDPNTGVHGYVSDRRLKTAIRPMEPVMDKVMQLEPVQYRMTTQAPDAIPCAGFIAQEVRKLFPEVVTVMPGQSGSNKGKGLEDLHMLNYSQFFVLAIKAIQEQQAEIAELIHQLDIIEQSKK
jgi:hypothetical protein